MNSTINRISGSEKAAILLRTLAPETSGRVMELLTPDERTKVTLSIESLRSVDSVSRRMVIDEVTKHIREVKRNTKVLSGNEQNSKLLVWMEQIEPSKVAEALSTERAQSAAMVLSVLSPLFSAKVLALLDEKMRKQVVGRLATLKPVSDKALQSIDEAMKSKLLNAEEESKAQQSSHPLTKILESAAEQVRLGVAPNETPNPNTVVQSTAKYTSPEQMLGMSDAEMFEVLSRIRMDDLISVLRVAGEDLKAKVVRNLSEDSARVLKRALNTSEQTTLRELEEANRRVLNVLNSWSETYKISTKTAA